MRFGQTRENIPLMWSAKKLSGWDFALTDLKHFQILQTNNEQSTNLSKQAT